MSLVLAKREASQARGFCHEKYSTSGGEAGVPALIAVYGVDSLLAGRAFPWHLTCCEANASLRLRRQAPRMLVEISGFKRIVMLQRP